MTFVGTDGTEWDLTVSPEETETELLLKLDPAAPSTFSPAAAQSPPPQLELNIERIGDGWRIGNRSPAYTWRNCKAAVADSTAQLPALAPSGAVMVNPTDFEPALGGNAAAMWVSCPANGSTLTVISK